MPVNYLFMVYLVHRYVVSRCSMSGRRFKLTTLMIRHGFGTLSVYNHRVRREGLTMEIALNLDLSDPPRYHVGTCDEAWIDSIFAKCARHGVTRML